MEMGMGMGMIVGVVCAGKGMIVGVVCAGNLEQLLYLMHDCEHAAYRRCPEPKVMARNEGV